MTTVANAPAQASPTTAQPRSIRIYEYSDMVYWWAIWFAALIGIVLTYSFGENFQIGDKSLLHSLGQPEIDPVDQKQRPRLNRLSLPRKRTKPQRLLPRSKRRR